VLDVGCGSGVLSIAASKLGFAPVLGIDFDPQAVEATERNAAQNGVEVDVRLGDLREAELPDADLALANIAADAVGALGARLRTPRAITSGYLVSDDPVLEGYGLERRIQNDGWAADLHVRFESL
jgi:ribosomal protein L11 methyltransferase